MNKDHSDSSPFKSYFIRDIEVRNGLVLAPMSGVTTCAFRRLIKELNGANVGLLMTEFISVEALTRNVNRAIAAMKYVAEERPIAVQVFGYDVDRVRDGARMAEDAGADIIDLNCGCPAPKVVRKGGGCELMRQPDHLSKILRAVRSAIKVPFTMKMRSGWDESCKNAIDLARMAESEGVEAIAVHGRTRAQLYRGAADWNLVREVARAVKIPVLGSGDVTCRKSAIERLEGVAGLYIGRGAIANPYIFTEIVENRSLGIRTNNHEAIRIVRRYTELLLEEFPSTRAPSHFAVGRIKQLVTQMCRGLPWRKAVLMTKTLSEIEDILNRAADQQGSMIGRSQASEDYAIAS